MNLEEKFNILVNKMNLGHYDEVILETDYLIKKFPKLLSGEVIIPVAE